jgi:osmoprotectant transport system permease protein
VDDRFAAALRMLPSALGQHVLLSACALALGVVISLPLAVVAARNPRLRWAVLTLAGLIQTIPSLALLALFYPLLLALSAASRAVFGAGFSALGFLPALLALTLYSMLPILRNTVTGILSLDPAVIEAARGVGMSERQRLFQVELPLAAPMIMAGVRTAAVWTIGAATLSTPVGQTSLGDYIFSGLQTEDWVLVLFGCIAAAVLALVVDQLLGLIEAGAARRDRRRVLAGAVGLVAGVALGLAPLALAGAAADQVVLGAKDFSEQSILAEVMADRLHGAGYAVSIKSDLGSAVAYRALASGEIDAYVDYSGTLWANVLRRTDNPPRGVMLDDLAAALRARDGVLQVGALGFENAYVLAMRRGRAAALGIASIADLAPHAPGFALGSDYEFPSRPEWAALKAAYGLNFRAERRYQSTFMYNAVVSGEVDVISAYTTDGRIFADDLVVLSDPKQAIPPYDAVILVSPRRAGDARFLAALRPMIGAISAEAMRKANLSVDRDRDKATPQAAARALEAATGLVASPLLARR